jgi:hypothetical protein
MSGQRRRKAASSDPGIPSVLDRLTHDQQDRLITVLADLLLSAVENLERAGIDPRVAANDPRLIARATQRVTWSRPVVAEQREPEAES